MIERDTRSQRGVLGFLDILELGGTGRAGESEEKPALRNVSD